MRPAKTPMTTSDAMRRQHRERGERLFERRTPHEILPSSHEFRIRPMGRSMRASATADDAPRGSP